VAIDPLKAFVRKHLSVVDRNKWRCAKVAVRELLQSQEHTICLVAAASAMRESTNKVIQDIRRDSDARDKMTNTEQIERLLNDRC